MTLSQYVALAFLGFVAFAPAAAPPAAIDSDRVTALLGKLDDDEFETRLAADEELRKMGKPVVPYLRDEQLRTASLEVRARLGRILRDLNADERVPDLVRQLSHKDARFRDHAKFALGTLSPDHLPALEAELSRTADPAATRVLLRVIAELRTPQQR